MPNCSNAPIWTGNPGSKPTLCYQSMKALCFPEAPWAGTDVKDYPADAYNTRNNSITFFKMPDRRLAHIIARTYGTGTSSDWTTSRPEISYSSDEGRTWTDSVPLLLPDPLLTPGIRNAKAGDLAISSVLEDGEGGYLVFATLRYNNHAHSAVILCKTKDFITFTPWQRTFIKDSYVVLNNSRILRLKSGRILIPVANHARDEYREARGQTYSTTSWELSGDFTVAYGAMVNFFYSDDNGETWAESPYIGRLPGNIGLVNGLQEPGVCQLPDGRIWAWARTELGCQYQMFSLDDGVTWTEPEPSVFISSLSPLTMINLPDGRLAAAWNPIPEWGLVRDSNGPRTPIILSTSEDGGKTWNQFRVLDDARDGFYCYPALYAGYDDHLLISYWYSEYGNVGPLGQSKIKYVDFSEL